MRELLGGGGRAGRARCVVKGQVCVAAREVLEGSRHGCGCGVKAAAAV